MKIFLDIGAHLGETLQSVSSSEWEFDRIYCFEPAPSCWPVLDELADERTTVCRFGLWSSDAQLPLHNAGSVGASFSADKDGDQGIVACELRDAATWFAENLRSDDEIFAKINIEGAEFAVIDRLATGGELRKLNHLLIHFDTRKVPSLRGMEADTKRLLETAGVEFNAAEDILFGGVARGTRNWLRWCHSSRRSRDFRFKKVARWEGRLRRALYPTKVRYLKLVSR
ncbi:hypothetical protein [Aeromicrobium sp. CF3.5]|uniref:hypothetical protein n=1 Tax=Aeromicrobium sp. CF3.5 TaxID=3373078 RepID=UPI003EE4D336